MVDKKDGWKLLLYNYFSCLREIAYGEGKGHFLVCDLEITLADHFCVGNCTEKENELRECIETAAFFQFYRLFWN